jgi:hypothetical protein
MTFRPEAVILSAHGPSPKSRWIQKVGFRMADQVRHDGKLWTVK